MPVVFGRNESGQKAAQKSADYGAPYIGRRSPPRFGCAPFVKDVSDGDREDSGSEDALQKSPEQQRGQAVGRCRRQGGHC